MIHIIPSEKRNCCGCNGCVQICPQKCISMVEDSEGFRYPRIDTDICINCGLCEKVCPILNKKVTDVKIVDKYPKALGGWHKEEKVRSESSSGGAFTLFAEYIIREGGIVYGCTLNKELQALHVGIEKLEELKSLRGSKYVQSEIGNVYLEIKDHLLNGRKVLFVMVFHHQRYLQVILSFCKKNIRIL